MKKPMQLCLIIDKLFGMHSGKVYRLSADPADSSTGWSKKRTPV